MAQITYVIGADTTEIVAKLDEVVRAFNGVGKSAAATERKVKKTTDTGSKGAKKLETGFISLKEGAEGFGGEMGAVAGRIDKFAKSAAAAGSAMGPWGMGIAAVTLGLGGLAWAVTAVATAAVEFVSGADDMIDRLNEMAGIDPVPAQTLQHLSEFDAAMLAAEESTTRLKVLLAGEFADVLTDMAWAFVGVVQGVQDFYAWTQKSDGAVQRLLGTLEDVHTVLTVGLSEAFGNVLSGFAESVREANTELTDLAGVEFDEFGPSIELFEKNEREITKAAEKAEQDRQKARDAARKEQERKDADAAKERAKINKMVEDELRKDAEQSAKETDAEQKAALNKWKADQAERVRINAEASRQIVKDVADATAKIDAFYEALGDAIKEAMHSALSATADLVEHFAGQAMEREREQLEKQQEIQEESRGGFRDHLDKIKFLEDQLSSERDADRRKQLQDEIDSQKRQVNVEKDANKTKRKNARDAAKEAHKAMVKAFRTQKAAQVSQVIIDGAAAYMGLLAAFAPAGPFAPKLAGAITVPAIAASVAKIASEKPPKFHDGVGAVDEMLATLRSGEAVLSQRGAQAAGGPQAIEALNRGTPPGPTTLVFQYAGRAVERVVLDAMQRGGPLQAAMAGGPAGVLNPYGSK
jgi:hypothetical protein